MPKFFQIRRGDREAALLTLGLWTVTYPIFLIPSIVKRGHLPELWVFGSFLPCVLAGLALSPVIFLAVRRTDAAPAAARWTVIVAAVLGIAFLQSQVDAWILAEAVQRFAPGRPPLSVIDTTANNFLIYVWLYALYATALALMASSEDARERDRQLAEARTAAHQAQLAALRFQLNPHFLFNTLNAISTLIVTKRNGEAEVMMQKLSEFLRASLASDPEGFITLADELATMEAYLDIESVRFGERLNVAIVCPDALLDAQVPSFLLQPLVENAVKYAVAPARRTVTIRVEGGQDGDDLVLMVEDDGDGQDRVATRSGTGVGLQNVRQRLEVLYGPRGVLEAVPRERGFLAIVRLPLIHTIGLGRAAA